MQDNLKIIKFSLLYSYDISRVRLLQGTTFPATASRWRYIGNAKTKVEVGLEIWRQKSATAMLSALIKRGALTFEHFVEYENYIQ